MGLDWNPGPKAQVGCEDEFHKLWAQLHAKWCFRRSHKLRRFGEITLSAFDTLGTPTVGRDESADEWALQIFPKRQDETLNWQQFYAQMRGFRVLDLVSPCDGIPRYTNGAAGGYVERYAFRAAFLNDCTEIIGNELVASAYQSKLPAETESYGAALLQRAVNFGNARSIDTTLLHMADDPDSAEFHLDVVFSAGRWCRFWGERGHWLDAYF
jgi:hypothetical protein